MIHVHDPLFHRSLLSDLSYPSQHMISPLVEPSGPGYIFISAGYQIHNCECPFLLPPDSCKGCAMVKTPCQQIVWDVLPAIRAALAADLVKNGVSQQEVARLLDIAPSAVSQYLSGKRGYRIVFEGPVVRLIGDLAWNIKAGGVPDVTARICAICHEIRDDQDACASMQEPGP